MTGSDFAQTAAAVLIALVACLVGSAALLALVLGTLLVAGSPGLVLLVAGGACVWWGLK